MRVGVLTRGETQDLDWVQRLGLRSIEWMRFDESPVAAEKADWKPAAEEFAAQAKARNIRISAIGALYKNPLDPHQTEFARAIFRRAIQVAGHIGIRTVAGFPGGHVETEIHPQGGNPTYKPFENFIPQLLVFWEPIAQYAEDHGVRIAFEHCPQGPYHLPVMNYNMLGQPAMWERVFNACKRENIGIEWDASHLICQFVDPVANIHKFGSKIFHVHAKDAFINKPLLAEYGICHPGVAEHRFPGLGQSSWAEIVHALVRAGYDSDLNIEGRHDPVYRDHNRGGSGKFPWDKILAGRMLEEPGILIAKRTLEFYTVGLES